ncbi:hypothetical protein R3P38DRAFT_2799601 [Favolaschia claudopus]|uniref:Ribosomal protein S3 n=1 Tax=Favolaschia claudopus TaxID=2862362 RepID=A0AAW0A079_9AGAR
MELRRWRRVWNENWFGAPSTKYLGRMTAGEVGSRGVNRKTRGESDTLAVEDGVQIIQQAIQTKRCENRRRRRVRFGCSKGMVGARENSGVVSSAREDEGRRNTPGYDDSGSVAGNFEGAGRFGGKIGNERHTFVLARIVTEAVAYSLSLGKGLVGCVEYKTRGNLRIRPRTALGKWYTAKGSLVKETWDRWDGARRLRLRSSNVVLAGEMQMHGRRANNLRPSDKNENERRQQSTKRRVEDSKTMVSKGLEDPPDLIRDMEHFRLAAEVGPEVPLLNASFRIWKLCSLLAWFGTTGWIFRCSTTNSILTFDRSRTGVLELQMATITDREMQKIRNVDIITQNIHATLVQCLEFVIEYGYLAMERVFWSKCRIYGPYELPHEIRGFKHVQNASTIVERVKLVDRHEPGRSVVTVVTSALSGRLNGNRKSSRLIQGGAKKKRNIMGRSRIEEEVQREDVLGEKYYGPGWQGAGPLPRAVGRAESMRTSAGIFGNVFRNVFLLRGF